MPKPRIGVLPLWDEQKESLWMLPGYTDGILNAGGLPAVLPLCEDRQILHQLANELDGFLFTGGQDVSPELYNREPHPLCGEICPRRDCMEQMLFEELRLLDKPVLGICRGLQIINVLLGGTLYQDLSSQYPRELVPHVQKPPYSSPCHRVKLLPEGALYSLLAQEFLQVSSYHHQAVEELAPGLIVDAVADDGVVEAVYLPAARFVWAVQWHPEFMLDDPSSQAIFAAFVNACR